MSRVVCCGVSCRVVRCVAFYGVSCRVVRRRVELCCVVLRCAALRYVVQVSKCPSVQM